MHLDSANLKYENTKMRLQIIHIQIQWMKKVTSKEQYLRVSTTYFLQIQYKIILVIFINLILFSCLIFLETGDMKMSSWKQAWHVLYQA